MTASARRPDKELLIASKVFTTEDLATSWFATLSTMALMMALVVAAVAAPWWPLRLFLALINGLVIVRAFCLFHDFQHGALLRKSKPAQALYWLFGTSILVPPSVWKETHNYHHAHTAKVIGSHIGSYPVVTSAMWPGLSKMQQVLYKLARHPLNMFLAVLTLFTIGMCIRPVLRAPLKHWGGLVSLALVYGTAGILWWSGHGDWFVFGWLIPMWLAAMEGAYLFYAQHNFPNGHIADRSEWSFGAAALDSSSFMKMNGLMNWLTANIGYHHVHHLNAAIPFYRLPEAMESIPELQTPGVTSFSVKDIADCFKLKVWDVEQQKMVGYPKSV
jgi:acyl-lipid omega-6 desaturase (Delta-12 desaturase)